jgi:glucan phosphorylase
MVLKAAGGVASVFLNNTVAARAGRPGVSFEEALTVTRAGNVFANHTAVEVGFGRFGPDLMRQYVSEYADNAGNTAPTSSLRDRRPGEREAHPKAANQEATLAAIARSLELSPTTLPSPTE